MAVFNPFDVLIPKAEYMEKWPVVACDQFTSQPEYWERLRKTVGRSPSALNCILPEVELKNSTEDSYESIRKKMREYLDSELFNCHENSFVYIERTLLDGSVRPGLAGVIDLEEYDFHADSTAAIRATERTVEERIPPRMKVRRGAKLELSHVILLCDDEKEEIIEPLAGKTGEMEKIYDLELLQGGGRIKGWLVSGREARALEKRIEEYTERKAAYYGGLAPMLFAVGDGNHSLATAKECYEELKYQGADGDSLRRARYAMVELENIRDKSQQFEPIHRLIYNVDVDKLLSYLEKTCCAREGYPVSWSSGDKKGTIYLDKRKGILPVAIIQSALDEFLAGHEGEIDYIHGEAALESLADKEGSIGFALSAVEKSDFFMGIAKDGVLPRKTFSMGHAQEKRYYLEARQL